MCKRGLAVSNQLLQGFCQGRAEAGAERDDAGRAVSVWSSKDGGA